MYRLGGIDGNAHVTRTLPQGNDIVVDAGAALKMSRIEVAICWTNRL
jgi:hypothetical protein